MRKRRDLYREGGTPVRDKDRQRKSLNQAYLALPLSRNPPVKRVTCVLLLEYLLTPPCFQLELGLPRQARLVSHDSKGEFPWNAAAQWEKKSMRI